MPRIVAFLARGGIALTRDPLARAREAVASATRIVALTGAGISAESGVPTFRGADGLWRSFRAEELATPGAFARDPRLVWEWYAWRRERVAACSPNAAHHALAARAIGRGDLAIVTQNVDGLHVRAAHEAAARIGGAADAALPLELHGRLFGVRCTRCDRRAPHESPVDSSSVDTLPRCPSCGALLRPDVVWFGEMLDEAVLSAAAEAAARADVCLVIGTSALVHPAAGLAGITREAGGRVIEVNIEATALTPVASISLRAPATAVVPALLGA